MLMRMRIPPLAGRQRRLTSIGGTSTSSARRMSSGSSANAKAQKTTQKTPTHSQKTPTQHPQPPPNTARFAATARQLLPSPAVLADLHRRGEIHCGEVGGVQARVQTLLRVVGEWSPTTATMSASETTEATSLSPTSYVVHPKPTHYEAFVAAALHRGGYDSVADSQSTSESAAAATALSALYDAYHRSVQSESSVSSVSSSSPLSSQSSPPSSSSSLLSELEAALLPEGTGTRSLQDYRDLAAIGNLLYQMQPGGMWW